MDEDKKRIRPKIVIEEGEKLPSVDSMSDTQEPAQAIQSNGEVASQTEPAMEEITPKVEEQPSSTILAEETKDTPANDIKIVIPPQPIEKKKSKLTFVLLAVVIALIVALLAGGIYVYMNGMGVTPTDDTNTTLLSPTPSSTDNDIVPTPSATPNKNVDVSTLKVNILNGSGKIGEAGKVKTAIEKEGYKVTNTGNAASFDFKETVIQAKEGTAQIVIDQLEEILSDSYEVEIGDSLKTSTTYDIVITVGSATN